jgi:DNA-binding MarR family transcriptional regulator
MDPPPTPIGEPTDDLGSDAWLLTDVITRLRRVLRSSIRSDYPWETLPMAQVEILQRLSEEPGLRVSELAQRHRLATNTVSTLIQQMVVTDLVTRVADKGDRRAVSLHLTELGQARLTGWLRSNQQRITAALEHLAPEHRGAIREALTALAELANCLEQTDRSSQAPREGE